MEFVYFWPLFGIACAIVASNKGRSVVGWFLLGVLLGPFGLIFGLVASKDEQRQAEAAMVSGEGKKCPYCAELIKEQAIKSLLWLGAERRGPMSAGYELL